jgi:hypothetical protein
MEYSFAFKVKVKEAKLVVNANIAFQTRYSWSWINIFYFLRQVGLGNITLPWLNLWEFFD